MKEIWPCLLHSHPKAAKCKCLPVIEEILRFLRRTSYPGVPRHSLGPENPPGLAPPALPTLPRDVQGTEPQAAGTSPVCPHARLGWAIPALGKGTSPAKATLQPWAKQLLQSTGALISQDQWSKATLGGFVLGPRQEPSQPRLAATPRDTAGCCPGTPGPSLLQGMPAHTHCSGTAHLWSTDKSSNGFFFFL